MPETGIGLFPDVGGSWFLPRLPGHTGAWMALTGARLKAADCHALGIATDVMAKADLPAFKAALAADPAAVASLLADHGHDPGLAPIAERRADIDRLFAADTVEGVVAALAADPGEWAAAQAAVIAAKSPLSLKTALRQIRTGAGFTDFAQAMTMEMRIAARLVRHHDFTEGVRAVILDKDNAPRWDPATLEGVTPAMLDAVFAPLPPDQEWSPQPISLPA
jgi:enoyl-CoA hydratase